MNFYTMVDQKKYLNPFKTDKTAANGNLGQCLKWKPQANVTRTYHQDDPRKAKCACAKLSILDIVHRLPRSLERVNERSFSTSQIFDSHEHDLNSRGSQAQIIMNEAVYPR